MTRRVIPAVLVLAVGLAMPGRAQTRAGEARGWEHERSDIPVNPRIRFGKLPTGFRYAWMANSEPNKRCYLRLHVNVGSLAEAEGERGLAHFLEHMAFSGSRRYPAGTLIEWLQKHGMAFGPDTNAHTAFGETVYKLDLPESDEKTLTEGLSVLRDFADGILLDEKEVQEEKGVIDGEQREGDSAGFRTFQETLLKQYSGSLVARRLPIGVKEDRDRFTSASVRAFYEKWYRPEQMTLVAVGDLGALDATPLIERAFADMKAPPGAPVLEPLPGQPSSPVRVFAIHEKEIPTVSVSLERLKPWEDEPMDVARWTRDEGLRFARRMLNLRFRELAKKPDAPFLRASVGAGGGYRVYRGETLLVSCVPEKWKEALAFAEQELRRALEHGFQQAELDEVRANSLRSLDESVAQEKTRGSLSFAEDILAAAEYRDVPTEAATDRKVLRPVVEALTLEKCQKDFVKAWGEGTSFVSLRGNQYLGPTADAQLTEAYEASRRVAVAAPAEVKRGAFAYASLAEAGKVASRKHVEDLDVHQVVFDNGVRLNVKKTDFKQRQVLVGLRLGEGRLSLEPAESVLAFVAGRILTASGLGAHSADELRRLLAGKEAGVGFGIGDDEFSLSGATTREDLLLQCELAAAYLQAPGWREEGLSQFLRQIPQFYAGLAHQHQGPVMQKFMPALYAGDPRFGIPTQAQVEAVRLEQVKAWLGPHLAAAPLEVTLIGDLDVEEAVAAAARTFGRLPVRRGPKRFEERRKVPTMRAGHKEQDVIETKIPKSLVLAVFPATDGIEASRRWNLSFLETVLEDRLRIQVREKLGAAYSPAATARLSRVYPGDGAILIQAMADPDKVDTLVEACLQTAHELATQGIAQEEVDRLREPLLNRLRDNLRTNAYWMGVLSGAQQRPEQLDDARRQVAHYRELKAETLSALAKGYLKRERASLLVVSPERQPADMPQGQLLH